MSVESIQNTAQVSGQYTIHAKREAQSASQARESQRASQIQNVQSEQRAAEADTYDKDNPVGVQAEGVYSISHDESGSLKVNYVKPAKSDDTEETQESPKSEAPSKSEPSANAETVSSASSDDELEELEQQRDAIRQQLNREQDENVKAQLRTQLQNIEAEIIQLKAN